MTPATPPVRPPRRRIDRRFVRLAGVACPHCGSDRLRVVGLPRDESPGLGWCGPAHARRDGWPWVPGAAAGPIPSIEETATP